MGARRSVPKVRWIIVAAVLAAFAVVVVVIVTVGTSDPADGKPGNIAAAESSSPARGAPPARDEGVNRTVDGGPAGGAASADRPNAGAMIGAPGHGPVKVPAAAGGRKLTGAAAGTGRSPGKTLRPPEF